MQHTALTVLFALRLPLFSVTPAVGYYGRRNDPPPPPPAPPVDWVLKANQLPTYPPTYQPTYLPTYLPTVSSYLPTYLPTCLQCLATYCLPSLSQRRAVQQQKPVRVKTNT